jgi:hypothetical protein
MESSILGNQSQYAQHRGCTRQAVSKAIKEERIYYVAGTKKINFDEADALWPLSDAPSNDANVGPLFDQKIQIAKNAAADLGAIAATSRKTEKDELTNELLRLKIEKERGKLIDRGEVESALFTFARSIQNSVTSQKTKFADKLNVAALEGGVPSITAVLVELEQAVLNDMIATIEQGLLIDDE